MEFRFNADEWATLSPAQQARRCRLMAAEARKLAGKATPAIRAAYLLLERDWQGLADGIEKNSN